MIENNIKTDLELCYLSKQLQNNGQPMLADWLMLHPSERTRLDIIRTAWKMELSEEQMKIRNTPHLERLREYLTAEHAADTENDIQCGGRWLQAAVDILQRNQIPIELWQESLRRCLQLGRNKKNNIFLVGSRNCGKTFLLRPLSIIYNTFCNPSQGSFNWVGAQDKDVILLNDFRYPPIDKGADKIISWQDLLNLCDADKLAIQAPK